MTARPRNKLFDIDIDEVSVVDRPANQGGLIAFAKAADGEAANQEDTMPDVIFDAEGNGVDEDELEHGDVVYDDDGNEYVFVVEDDDDDAEAYDEYDDSDELVGVGKATLSGPGAVVAGLPLAASNAKRAAGEHLKKHKKKYIGGAIGAGTAGAAGGGYMAYSKSLGDEVLEELSKAMNDADRDTVIAKAMDVVELYKAQSDEMAEQMALMEDQRIEEAFISKAAEYNLPVAPEVLGPILKAAATVLDEEQLDVLDELFNAVGDVLYDEIGYVGDTDNTSVLDEVSAVADELVGKADLTSAEALVAAFDANPAAYDQYLLENGR